MSGALNYSDNPIQSADADVFGINGFAISLAKSILKMNRPEGIVIAVNGPWGSGKSSLINLLKHHLRNEAKEDEIATVPFNPWWFRGEDALTLGFFTALQQAMKPSLTERSKKALPKIGAAFLRLASNVAPAADAVGASGMGAATSAALNWISGFIDSDENVESLFDELAESLGNVKKRFVIVIDDIDRLGPDEALTVFRLIKSVGRLPNTTYVLAFDRILSERMVSERFPSEGSNYLEKIIQVSFDIPLPIASSLNRHLLDQLGKILGEVGENSITHVMNIFHEVVSPEIRTPRDVSRYLNALSLTWPCVAGEVDIGDFIAIEAYRLFQPALFQAIRDNEDMLCGAAAISMYKEREDGTKYDVVLLNSVPDKERYRKGLMRLFPKLESIWSNTYHDGSEWRQQRRVCVQDFFPVYFRLSLPENVIPNSEVKELISRSNKSDFIASYLKDAARRPLQSGGSRAALLLDALKAHAKEIPLENAKAFLSGLFRVADEINIPADEGGAFEIADNRFRIHWLMRALLKERTALQQRSEIIRDAAASSSLYWFVDLASSAWNDYHPTEGKQKEVEDKCLCTEGDSQFLYDQVLGKIRAASQDGSLVENRRLAALMYQWRHAANDDGVNVKNWVASHFDKPNDLAKIAVAQITVSWRHSMSDTVSTKHERLSVNSLDQIMDKDDFKKRIEQLKSSTAEGSFENSAAKRFLSAWEYSLDSKW